MKCADCKLKRCYTNGQNCTRLTVDDVKDLYSDDDRNIMAAAACTEAQNYMKASRLEESVFFAQQLGVKKIGLAFCIGLAKEANLIAAYFKKFFEVESVCCKVCGVAKEHLALEQIKPDKVETMCNPKVQAEMLNQAGTELNFTIGLCVGHDILFTKGSKAPVSCLITKDRLLSHNPVGAVYSRYWKRKLGILEEDQV